MRPAGKTKRHGQLVAVEGLVQLWGDGVRQAGQGGDQEEESDPSTGQHPIILTVESA